MEIITAEVFQEGKMMIVFSTGEVRILELKKISGLSDSSLFDMSYTKDSLQWPGAAVSAEEAYRASISMTEDEDFMQKMENPPENEIIAAGPPSPVVTEVVPTDSYTLRITFDNGEKKLFDVKPYLDSPVFRVLKNQDLFCKAYVEQGRVCWPGEIDLCYHTLYDKGIAIA